MQILHGSYESYGSATESNFFQSSASAALDARVPACRQWPECPKGRVQTPGFLAHRPSPRSSASVLRRLGEKGVRLAQNVQAGPRRPVGVRL
jgi:hypothetical protein